MLCGLEPSPPPRRNELARHLCKDSAAVQVTSGPLRSGSRGALPCAGYAGRTEEGHAADADHVRRHAGHQGAQLGAQGASAGPPHPRQQGTPAHAALLWRRAPAGATPDPEPRTLNPLHMHLRSRCQLSAALPVCAACAVTHMSGSPAGRPPLQPHTDPHDSAPPVGTRRICAQLCCLSCLRCAAGGTHAARQARSSPAKPPLGEPPDQGSGFRV